MEPNKPSSEQQNTRHARVGWLIPVVITAVTVSLAWSGIMVWQRHGSSNHVKTEVVTSTPSPAVVNDKETIIDQLVIASKPPLYQLSINTPKAWRGVEIRSQVTDLGSYQAQSFNDLTALLRFVPENASRNNTYSIYDPINTLNLVDVTDWLKDAKGEISVASKEKYIAYLKGLPKSKDLTSNTGCTPITSLGASSCVDHRVLPQAITTSDKSLGGVVYLTMQTQSVSYDPIAYVYMVGDIQGRTYYLQGKFTLYDKTYADLSSSNDITAIQKARDNYSQGKLADDTKKLYQHVIDAVASIKLSPR
jgi:hypothetical protein